MPKINFTDEERKMLAEQMGTKISDDQSIHQEEKKENEEFRINIPVQPFPELIAQGWITINDLCRLVNTVMRPVFADYLGSKIVPENGRLNISLCFKPNNNELASGQIRAFIPITETYGNSTADKIKRFNISRDGSNSRHFKATKEGNDVLRKFAGTLLVDRNGKKKSLDFVTEEGSITMEALNNPQACVFVHIDPITLMKTLFGSVNPVSGGRWDYSIQITTPVNAAPAPGIGVVASNWNLLIQRADKKDVAEVVNRLGFGYGGNDKGVITD